MVATDSALIVAGVLYPPIAPLVFVLLLLRQSETAWRGVFWLAGTTQAARILPLLSFCFPAAQPVAQMLPPPPPKQRALQGEAKQVRQPQAERAPHPSFALQAAAKHHSPLAPSTSTPSNHTRRAATTIEELAALASSREQNTRLLDVLDAVPHLALIGKTGAGKSVLLTHLATRYLEAGEQVVVLDPHGAPSKWPEGAAVVGAGRDYAAVERMLGLLVRLMQRRYEEIASGEIDECEHPRVHIIADEWRAIVKQIKSAGPYLGELITEARKANIRVILGAHSPYLTGLGLDDSAVRESLLLCSLIFDARGRRAMIDGIHYDVPVLSGEPEPVYTGIGGGIPVYTGSGPQENADVLSDKDIQKLIYEGRLSRNKVAARIGGSKDRALARIRRALGEE